MISFQKIFGDQYELLPHPTETSKLDYITKLDEGPIVIIFSHLPEWDRMELALTCKRILNIYKKYSSIQIPKETALKIFDLKQLPEKIESEKESYEKWSKYSSYCPNCYRDCLMNGIVGISIWGIVTTISTGFTASGKACGCCCACCIGTAGSCGITAGICSAFTCLCTCIGLTMYAPQFIEDRSKICEKNLKKLELREISLIQELNPPAKIKMKEN